MNNQSIIFSNRKQDRIWRHLLFWSVWAPYFILLHVASPSLKPEASNFNNIPFTATECFFILACQVPITYLTIYGILPFFSQKKQILKGLILMVVAWGLHYWIFRNVYKHYFPAFLDFLLPDIYMAHTQRPESVTDFMSLLAVFMGALTSTAFVAAFRTIKQWYQKEQKNIELQKQNAESELQLLTAQVHPNFLFNTLNNIYFHTREESPGGSKMILELGNVLRYILAEGSRQQVPLQKELDLIREYMNLEKIRYGNRLAMHLSMPQDAHHLYIAPLLLLPFVENCFKHGASRFLSEPWINLQIKIHQQQLEMKLINGRAPQPPELPMRSGTGIENVRKRLQLLYPGIHQLTIVEDATVFEVILKLKLNPVTTPVQYAGTDLKTDYA